MTGDRGGSIKIEKKLLFYQGVEEEKFYGRPEGRMNRKEDSYEKGGY